MATGGTTPYIYSWTSDAGYSGVGPSITGAPQGIYEAIVTDGNGCTAAVTITQNNCCDPSMYCTSTATNPTCGGLADGSISITPVGGVGPFSYTWSHDATITGALATDLAAGFYNVVVSDSGGCSAMCGIQLTEPGSIVIDDVAIVDPMCGLSDGSLTVTATPKTGSGCNDLEYSIDGGMNFQISNAFTDLPQGDYLVIVRDCDLCSSAQAAELMTPNGVSLSFTSDCVFGQINIDITPMGGTAPYTYAWTGPNGFTSTAEDLVGGDNGDYTIVVIDANGCSDQITIPEDISCFFGSIEGSVWVDANGNGVADPGEGGEANVPVNLYNVNGVLISSGFTSSDGDFLFIGQEPGQYYVEFEPSLDYSFTLPNVGSDATDSDVTGANGYGTTTLLNFTGEDLIVDAGIHLCVPVGELVWFDLNENDQWDPSENGINGLEVKVWKKGLGPGFFEYDNTYTGPKPGTPSDDGYYKFCLPPGEYYLEYIIPPFGLVPVVPGIGSSSNDSDLTGANGPNTTNTFSIISGEERCDLSAGYYPMATLGNSVFFDGNSNGIADPNEFGMSDVTIEIYNANSGQMVDSQTSNNDGSYLFDYLQKDDYYLKVVPPADFIVTIANAGNDDDMDSDIDNTNGPNTSATFSLTPGMRIDNVDIGFVEGITVAVDWISIEGENKGDYNQIDWAVAFQNNTEYFEIERRTPEETSFNVIDIVETNNLTSVAQYQYRDTEIEGHPLTYYRIVELDINGGRSYSDVVSIDIRSAARATKVTMGPNPFISDLIIEIDTPISGEASVIFWDISGKRIELPGMNNSDLSPGMNTLSFDWSGIPAGVYSAQVLVNNNQFVQKLIKIE